MNAKWMGWTLALTVPWLYLWPFATVADAGPPSVSHEKVAVAVYRTAGDDENTAPVVVSTPTGGAHVHDVVLSSGGKAPRSVAGSHIVMVVDKDADDDTEASDRAWLGVLQLPEIPPALAAQVPAAADGVLIHNVVRSSPAEQAGLQRYDVVTAVNGTKLTRGALSFAEAIGALSPGTPVTLTLLRHGQVQTVEATLAQRPARGNLECVYPNEPQEVFREYSNARGKIISQDENGKWEMLDLGDLADMQDLPDEIRELLPGLHKMSVKVQVNDDDQSITAMIIKDDGTSLSLEQNDSGDITVTREDRDGHQTEKTYADADALKAQDLEAYDLYQQVTTDSEVHLRDADEDDEEGEHVFRWHGMRPGQRAGDPANHEAWKAQFEEAMREARAAMEEAQSGADTAGRRMRMQFHGLSGLHGILSDKDGERTVEVEVDATTRRFLVQPDGRIEVTIRRNDTEVTKVFQDEDDLRTRAPEWYKAYMQTLADAPE